MIDELIKKCMIETERANEKDRIKVVGKEPSQEGQDIVNVFVNLYRPRSKNPDKMWIVSIDTVRGLIYWDKSKYYNLKEGSL